MLRFSKANAKIEALSKVSGLKGYLSDKRKVYSFDLLSGITCPGAMICKSQVVVGTNGKHSIKDGPHTTIRCFSASQEVLFPALYKMRKANMDGIIALIPLGVTAMADALCAAIPKNCGIIRLHVGGDFLNQIYFDAWLEVAKRNPKILIYAYTKSLNFLVRRLHLIPANFIYTASKGGRYDNLISEHNLREAVIVLSRYEAKQLGLKIDKTDEFAANPKRSNQNFALLVHGPQPRNTKAAKAWQRIKTNEGGYSRKKK